ncbi:lytic transglycosylase domain-containing protein, partial [Limimaricola sp. ASW11-118]
PRLQPMQQIARLHGADIMRLTIGTKVSPALALAVISVESAGRTDAVSSAGAQGLMQLMPATAARFGVMDRRDAAENIRGGIAYLDWLLGHFKGDPILALAGYNAGEGSVRDNAGVPPYAETRAYVPKVLAAWSVARGLCLTPPVLMSDGCVFAAGRL